MSQIVSRYIVERRGMTCGSAEAEAREFKIAVDPNSGVVWFYTLTDPDPAGHIYCDDPNDVRSDGYGGRTLTFRIGKCASYSAKGPWHANSESLYTGTGVDLRDKHLTFVVIAKRRGCDAKYRDVFEDIIYVDQNPVLGKFERGREMAKAYATEMNIPVVCYSESSGGSSSGWEYPEGTDHKDWKEWFQENSNHRASE